MKEHPARKKIIRFLKANPEATFEEIRKAAGVSSKSVVDYHIKTLMAAGMLRKINQWEVVETG